MAPTNPPTPSNPIHSIASDAVRETLGKSSDVDSCTTLTKRIDALLEEAIVSYQADGAGMACRAGCNFCCHLRVMVYPHEAIALFRYLRSRMPKEQSAAVRNRITDNAARIGKLDREGRMPANLPCAFLVDGACSAYEARPATCAGYHSLSRERCEDAFHSRETSQTRSAMDATGASDTVPMLQGLRFVATALDDGLDAGLAVSGLSAVRIELHTALAALLRNPSLIERWRSGRDLVKATDARGAQC
jgi:hypothetical protein